MFCDIQFIRREAMKLRIQNIEEKTKKYLINKMYNARNLWYAKNVNLL